MCSASGSAIVPGLRTSWSPYLSYCVPLVCVSNFPGGSAVWRFYKQTNKHTNKQSIKQTNYQTNKACRSLVVGPHLSSSEIDWLFVEIGTVSRGTFMCDVRCTAHTGYPCDSGATCTMIGHSASRGVKYLYVGLDSTIFLSG